MKNSAAGKLSPFVVKRKESVAALLAGSILLHSLCHLSVVPVVTVAGLALSWDGSLCSDHSPVAVRHGWRWGLFSSIDSPNISRLSSETRVPCLTLKTSLVLVFVCLF